jgi:competence protein ComFC
MAAEIAVRLWWDLLDLVYPQRCPRCDAALSSGREVLCERCLSELEGKRELLGPFCPSCKRQIDPGAGGCRCEGTPAVEVAYSLGGYAEEMESLIEAFKYKRKRKLGLFLSELMSERLLELEDMPSADLVVPVPLHRSKRRQRGFNQSEVIAGRLSERLEIQLGTGLVKRRKKTRTQTGLSREQRRENVRDAFEFRGEGDLQGRRVLLVDDVLTTGATMSECARTLKDAGAEQVWGVTLAVAVGIDVLRLQPEVR